MKYFMLGIHFISFFKKNIFFLCFIHAVIQLTGGGGEWRNARFSLANREPISALRAFFKCLIDSKRWIWIPQRFKKQSIH